MSPDGHPNQSPDDDTTQLRRLAQEHEELDARLRALERRAHLSPSEQVEVANLKKLKLRAKDRMQILAR